MAKVRVDLPACRDLSYMARSISNFLVHSGSLSSVKKKKTKKPPESGRDFPFLLILAIILCPSLQSEKRGAGMFLQTVIIRKIVLVPHLDL